VGRRVEHEAAGRLLARARAGGSGVLVVRGEPGIGKTTLLQHGRDTATAPPFRFRVESATGAEAEAEFDFAGLHQLCAPLLGRSAALPEPQQVALAVAFGMSGGAAPDRFLVELAVLSLLAEVAEDGPLLCLVDDAQWLDRASAQVLAFVARRLAAERVVLVFAVRDDGDGHAGGGDASAFTGLPDLRLVGLSDADARTLLAGTVHTPSDDAVRDRVLAEARGNPLALLELPRAAVPQRLAGGFELPDALSVPRRIEDAFRNRSGGLPIDTQVLLLVAAAPPDRRRAHDALGAATDPQVDPDRRAWHRGQAVLGTDEDVAAELERSAGRARARGGSAAAAAFLRRAAELSPDAAVRAGGALDAASTTHEAGASEAALELLSVAAVGPLDASQRARLELLRAQIALQLTQGVDVPGMLLDAAAALAPLDAALITGGPEHGRSVGDAAEAARTAPGPSGSPGPADLLLDGLATTYTAGFEAGAPVLRRALEAFCSHEPGRTGTDRDSRWLWLAGRVAVGLYDDETIDVLARRNVRLSREAGAPAALPGALLFRSGDLVLAGDLARAAELADEQFLIARATGAVPLRQARLVLAAWRGRETETAELHAASVRSAAGRGSNAEVTLAEYALAVLHNALGDYAAAREAASRACGSDELANTSLALPELVEAAARAGRPQHAVAAVEQLSSRAQAGGSRWALGLVARSRALTTVGPAAEELYREAIDDLGHSRMPAHLARTHLVYGEWLRRGGHRQAARRQLRTAHDMLSGMGADAFAARAARELRATGEHPRSRSAQPSDALTAQELTIARLVATGATSREVGAQLFLSPRTIEATCAASSASWASPPAGSSGPFGSPDRTRRQRAGPGSDDVHRRLRVLRRPPGPRVVERAERRCGQGDRRGGGGESGEDRRGDGEPGHGGDGGERGAGQSGCGEHEGVLRAHDAAAHRVRGGLDGEHAEDGRGRGVGQPDQRRAGEHQPRRGEGADGGEPDEQAGHPDDEPGPAADPAGGGGVERRAGDAAGGDGGEREPGEGGEVLGGEVGRHQGGLQRAEHGDEHRRDQRGAQDEPVAGEEPPRRPQVGDRPTDRAARTRRVPPAVRHAPGPGVEQERDQRGEQARRGRGQQQGRGQGEHRDQQPAEAGADQDQGVAHGLADRDQPVEPSGARGCESGQGGQQGLLRGHARHPDDRADDGEDQEPGHVQAPQRVDERQGGDRHRRQQVGHDRDRAAVDPVDQQPGDDPGHGRRDRGHGREHPRGQDVARPVEHQQRHDHAGDALAEQGRPVAGEVDGGAGPQPVTRTVAHRLPAGPWAGT
jgi:DNA-binding CsgD family transcriptional regulator